VPAERRGTSGEGAVVRCETGRPEGDRAAAGGATRREFIVRVAVVGLAVSGAAALLGACGADDVTIERVSPASPGSPGEETPPP
jgi:hypothetical protein